MCDATNKIIVTNTCSRCSETKEESMFILRRNICRVCNNARRKEQAQERAKNEPSEKSCTTCNVVKSSSEFVKNRLTCKDCNNNRRRNRYQTDETHRQQIIDDVTTFKKKKSTERQVLRQLEQEKIGIENKTCNYCKEIKHQDRFRNNRLKCRDCERDDPNDKFKRKIRSHIWTALKRQHTFKTTNTREYLGCEVEEYLQWLIYCNPDYDTMSTTTVWHIDHVIPLSRFDLNDFEQCLIAFNWRNTMPLPAVDNLKKNNKILHTNISEHVENLKKYHENTNIEIPNEFINLYATYLDAGTS
jgi:hypothetical protein